MADARSHLTSMTEEELLAIVTRPTHDRVWNAAFVTALVASSLTITILLGNRFEGGWLWLVAAAVGLLIGWLPGLVVGIAILAVGVTLTSRRRYRDELLRRVGWKGGEEELARARQDLAASGGPETIALFDGVALPHGGSHFIRLDMWQDHKRPPELRFQSVGRTEDDQDPRANFTQGTARLAADRADSLLRLVQDLKTRPPERDSRHGVIDGFPFTLTLLSSGAAAALSAHGNLSATPKDRRPCDLANSLLEIAAEQGRPSALVGSTSFDGHVRIEER